MNHELTQLINSFDTPVRIIDVDKLRRPVYGIFNEAALKDSGLNLEDVVGRTAAEVYPSVIGKIASNRHQTVIDTGRPLVFDIEKDTDQGRQYSRVTLAPMINDEGKVARILCTQIDVTAEKMVQSIETEAETRIREMEQYIALAAHDLRTPMRNVRMIAEFLREDFNDLGDGKAQMIDKLEAMSSKAMTLITEVLSHAQATSKRESKVSSFQLNELCDQLISILDPLGNSTLESDSSLLATDKITVQIALNNLIDNALKHNAPDSLLLTVSAIQASSAFIEIQVADNGKGFADSTLSFIETRKLRVDSGFGLVGISRMIRESGGEMTVKPGAANRGATISFTVPGTLLQKNPNLDSQ